MKKTIGAAVYAALFILLLILVRTVDVAAIGPAGTSVGLSHANAAFHEWSGVHMALYDATQYLGYLAILVALGFACAGLTQCIRRKSVRKVDREILALGVLYVVLACCYVIFEKVIINYRPILMPGETAPEASFPSSHTMLACVIFESAALLVLRYVKGKTAQAVLGLLCIALSFVTALLRPLSGVHWLTDIVAGVFLSTALLKLYEAALARFRTDGEAPEGRKGER
jgi:undecaprenyl-diphosphatase